VQYKAKLFALRKAHAEHAALNEGVASTVRLSEDEK
jgi:hypothetical protein